MSKITNDGLTRSGTGCFWMLYSCTHMATVGVKGLRAWVSSLSVHVCIVAPSGGGRMQITKMFQSHTYTHRFSYKNHAIHRMCWRRRSVILAHSV